MEKEFFPNSDTPIRGEGFAAAQWVMARALDIGEWERSMDHRSLIPYLKEEAAEVIEVIETDGPDEELLKELSDLLLQVLFHAELARRRGAFDMDDVAAAFVKKMESRAPYLFESGNDIVPVAEQERLWAAGKLRESASAPRMVSEADG